MTHLLFILMISHLEVFSCLRISRNNVSLYEAVTVTRCKTGAYCSITVI